jgi:acyl-CoA synthetase (AMP-forming)/AMP-acid ligase II
LARYKIPKVVKFVDELPMTAAQKIMRRKLREDYLGGGSGGKKETPF